MDLAFLAYVQIIFIFIYIWGIWQTLLSKVTYKKCICSPEDAIPKVYFIFQCLRDKVLCILTCLHRWLIEVNASPSLTASSQEDYEMKCRLLEDTLHIVDMEGRYGRKASRLYYRHHVLE